MILISVRIEDKQNKQLEQWMHRTGSTKSELIRLLLRRQFMASIDADAVANVLHPADDHCIVSAENPRRSYHRNEKKP